MRRSLLVSLIASLGALSLPAHAFYVETRAGDMTPARFADADPGTADTIDVELRLNTTGAPGGMATLDAIRAAFATWTSADCSTLVFSEGADATGPIDQNTRAHWTTDPAGTVYILVYFDDRAEEWTTGPAVGHFYFAHDPTGVLIGGTVVLNSRDHQWATDGAATAMDVQGTTTALLGRALGITSAMTGNATYPSYAPGDTTKRTLGADDLAAIQFLYPDAMCAMPTAPEAICDGTPPGPGEDPCPPRPTTMNDGGTIMPGTDGGAVVMRDAGVDGGGTTPMTSGGCGCRTASAPLATPAVGLLSAIFLFSLARRRRRR